MSKQTSTVARSLSVAAIKYGTVIDHITAGHALKIIRLLNLPEHQKKVTVGLNLTCKSMGIKDLIKVEDYELSEDEAHSIAVFAPKATINIIRNYDVTTKFKVEIPRTIEGIFACPNQRCITLSEPMKSFFFVDNSGQQIELICRYCRQRYEHSDIKEYYH